MFFDASDDEEVSYETFKKYNAGENSNHDPDPPSRNKDRLIIEITAHASENTENHMGPLYEVLNSDHITEEMIDQFEQYTLSNMSEKELIKVIVLLITRFQKCSKPSSRIHLKHIMSCLNDVRLMLVILTKKFIAHEFMFVYRMSVWKYFSSYLKYLSGLIRIESCATASISQHEAQLVHMFKMLARLFQVKQVQDDLRMDFMNYLVHLFFSSTSGPVNQAISHVICTAIHEYDWMDIYLYDMLKYDTSDETVRTKFNFTIHKKKYNVHSTTMLLIQLIDHEMELFLHQDIQVSIRSIFTKSYQIINLALKYNQKVLVDLMKDLNKMTVDLTEIPKSGIMLLYNCVLLQIREMVISDRIISSEHGEVIDAYFEMMTQVCENFKNVKKESKHLEFSPDVIYELLHKVDNATDQFTLLSIMLSTNILSSKQSLSEEDKSILKQSKISFKDSKQSSTRKPQKENKRNKTSAAQVSNVLLRAKQSDIALCFNYFINERLNETVLTYCLQTFLIKLKNAQSQASVARYVKYLNNLKHFCSKSYQLLDDNSIMNTMSVMYEIAKSSEHKAVHQVAISIICNFCSKRDSYYQMFKVTLAYLLSRTDNSSVLKILCEFFLDKFEDLHEKLNLIKEPLEQPDLDSKSIDIEFTVIHALLVRLRNPNFKPIILSFFSKLWFEWETLSSKLDHKVEQMIKLVKLNWREEFKELIKEFFKDSVDMKKSTILCAKQIVYNVIQSKKDDNMAWEVVLFFSEVKSNFLVEYFGELYELIQELVATREINRFQVLAKVVTNIIVHNKGSIDHDKLKEFQRFLASTLLLHNVRQDVKITCIELMQYFDWEEEKIQKNFSAMYVKMKQRLELCGRNLTESKINENSYVSRDFFCDMFTLAIWLNNWPDIITKCKDFKHVHITLVQDICDFYYRTENKNDRYLAIRSLGKIHWAFPNVILKEKVVALYSDILKNSSDDGVKHLIITNIHCHIEEIMKRLETIEEKSTLNVKCMDHAMLDNVSLTVNTYLSSILHTYYTIRHPTIRGAVTRFLVKNLRFGTLVAHQVVEHMIPMLQDNNFQTTDLAYQELENWNRLDPTLLINSIRKGTINSYKLERLISSVKNPSDDNNNTTEKNKSDVKQTRGYKTEKDSPSPTLKVLFELVQKKSEVLLKVLIKCLEEEIHKLSNPGLFVYIVDNIALFPYTTLPQLRAVIYEMEAILSSTGTALLELNDENEARTYETYLKMAQINLLIQLKSFLWEKYVIPSDLIHNKRYETVKLKLKLNTSFHQQTELESISKHVAKLFVRRTDVKSIQTELHVFRGVIARELMTKRDSDDLEEPTGPIQTYAEYKMSRANQNTDGQRKQTENLVKDSESKKFESNDENNNIPNQNHSEIHKQVKASTVVKQCQAKKNINDQRETPTNRGVNKIIIPDNEAMDANNNSMMANLNHEPVAREKKSYKELFQVKRPIPPHIVEKAKQANIDWMITQPCDADVKEMRNRPRKSQVHFDINENMEEDAETFGTKSDTRVSRSLEIHDVIIEKEVQKSRGNMTNESTGIEINHAKTAENETLIHLDNIIDAVVNNTESLNDDMDVMKESKKQLKERSNQNVQSTNKIIQRKQTVEKQGYNNLDHIIDAVVNNTESSDDGIVQAEKHLKKRSNQNVQRTNKTIQRKQTVEKQGYNNLDHIIDAVVNNTESSDDGIVQAMKASKKKTKKKTTTSNVNVVDPCVDKNSIPKYNESGNEADEDDDLDFINENKKRIKRQDTSNKKKVKKNKGEDTSKVLDKKKKKRKQAKLNVSTLMQNLMVSTPTVRN